MNHEDWYDDRKKAERLDWLRARVADGLSAQQMSNLIGGGVSRNAVIGVAHRGKVALVQAPPSRRKNMIKPPKDPRVQHRARVEGFDADAVPRRRPDRLPEPQAAGTIMDLSHGSAPGVCHFPMFTDTQLAASTSVEERPYCCAPTGSRDDAYCEFHRLVMYPRLMV